MTDVSNALEAVAALIAERTKYEGWISALATKSDVPSHVLEKVRADYTSRLRSVLQAFTGHTPALDAALSELQSRDGSLAAQEKACRDEHAEGELRHMVGEYDADQWDKVRIGHEALLSRLASERQGIAGELSGVQRSLAAAADAAQRARSIGDMVVTPPSSGRLESPTPAIQGMMGETAAPPPAPVYEEPPVQQPYRPTPVPASPEPVERRPLSDDLGFLRTTPRNVAAPRDGGMAAEAASTATAMKSPETPMLRIVPNATPAQSPPQPVDAAKTLRCAECGTMNYATEWYCERCGGELAVL
ncbi:MAG: hypothetical protein V4813_08820 [Gemmatimonadota bacterium]